MWNVYGGSVRGMGDVWVGDGRCGWVDGDVGGRVAAGGHEVGWQVVNGSRSSFTEHWLPF